MNVEHIGFHGRRRCEFTPATSRPLSELEQQGLIQAFEFTHELSWLLVKDFLVYQRVSKINGSRDAVREAVRNSRVCSRNAAGPKRADDPWHPQADSQQLLKLISTHKSVEKIMLYGSRALGRQRAGSDIDLFLVAPSMNLRELLELGAALDDLTVAIEIDLQCGT